MMKSYYNHNKDLKFYTEQVSNGMIKNKLSILMITQVKIKLNTIKSRHVFQIIHTEY